MAKISLKAPKVTFNCDGGETQLVVDLACGPYNLEFKNAMPTSWLTPQVKQEGAVIANVTAIVREDCLKFTFTVGAQLPGGLVDLEEFYLLFDMPAPASEQALQAARAARG